ncbi:putative origin recognition complex subunit 3 [Talaromyces proteolyticus]|uniref:Origin recognition complex subunit 3 n=1 Tax=Talaromyces proteolyticus TaxID=1131652 RepID=A0AAD4KW53_9EURO|nr:putative origin recognition complex subunit 3 [Talaromyces proteolyticus]KAH8701139.1 putative origin recognition complex subunit 3 [Talaromyces proteolyticus]
MELDDEELNLPGKIDGDNPGVYIYNPTKATIDHLEPSPKRRKTSKSASSSLLPNNATLTQSTFVPLLDGKEPSELVESRQSIFQQLWTFQEQRSKEILEELDSGILEAISSFVDTASPELYDGRIPTSLVTIGSNVSALPRLLDSLHQRLTAQGSGQVVLLESGDAPNLKAVLKTIIRIAVTSIEGNEGYQHIFTHRLGPRMLPYDLNLLHEYVDKHKLRSLVLAFRDSEAFDSGVLNDLLSLLSAWIDRIPFVLLFGVSTSVEIFEARLPRSIVASLQGQHFEIHDAGDAVDRIYEALQTNPNTELWLGPHLSKSLFERSRDYFQSPEEFIREVKYAYMSHFFANPLSVLLSPSAPRKTELSEAIRNLNSFRRFCEELLEAGYTSRVRDLLNDDEALLKEVDGALVAGQSQMRDLLRAANMLQSIQTVLQTSKASNRTEIILPSVSGDIRSSLTISEMLTTIKKSHSDGFAWILTAVRESNAAFIDVEQYEGELNTMLKTHESEMPLRSSHDDQNSTVETTIVKSRLNLTKVKKQVSAQDIEYTDLLERFLEEFEKKLDTTFINPQDLFLHEVFLFDIRNPLKDTFAPRARFSVERALSNPFDYLTSASEGAEANLSANQPETAILYQLYLESGSLVNVFDLWKAFSTIVASDENGSCDERTALVLFYRATSELKALGMMKTSRKKIDHVSKSAWKGL